MSKKLPQNQQSQLPQVSFPQQSPQLLPNPQQNFGFPQQQPFGYGHNPMNNGSQQLSSEKGDEEDTLSLNSEKSDQGFINEPLNQWPSWTVPGQNTTIPPHLMTRSRSPYEMYNYQPDFGKGATQFTRALPVNYY